MKFFARKAFIGLAALLAAEAAARLLIPMDFLAYRDSDDPALAFELRPGSSGIKNGVPVEINEQGLRDEVVPAAKPRDERRVVVVGGHETFGIGVEAKDTFVRELAEGLIEPGHGRARTVNLSMYSYHFGQKVELACQRLPGMAPELVVLQITEGDGGSPTPPLFRLPHLKNWIREHSVLVRWASELVYLGPRRERPAPAIEVAQAPAPAARVEVKAASARPGEAAPARAADARRAVKIEPAPPSKEFEEARAQLRRFKECVDAAGARPVVMLLPDITAPPSKSPSELRRGLESAAKELGMPLLDARPALEALPPEERAVFPRERFLSPAAQRALADELRRRLRPLLKKRRVPAPERPSV